METRSNFFLVADLVRFCRWISLKSGHSWREVGSVLCYNSFESQIILCYVSCLIFTYFASSNFCKFPKKRHHLKLGKLFTSVVCPGALPFAQLHCMASPTWLSCWGAQWKYSLKYDFSKGRIRRLLGTKCVGTVYTDRNTYNYN